MYGRAVRVVLVRVGVDQAYGNWTGRVDPETHEFVCVPIPEERKTRPDLATPYTIVIDSLASFGRGRVVDAKACALPDVLHARDMHLDPDFQRLAYGNNPNSRGDIVNRLVANDVVVFYAGLRPCRAGGTAPALRRCCTTGASACDQMRIRECDGLTVRTVGGRLKTRNSDRPDRATPKCRSG